MTYREPLPDDCPPDEPEEITSPRLVYHLVRNNPPTGEDFISQRGQRPERVFPNISECQARGLSVHNNPASAMELMGLRTMRGRMLCRVRLDHGAGRIMQTGKDLHHNTWWPLADYDVLAISFMVAT